MTKVVGLLSWYDESPTRLAACVTSMARFCDHVCALDGRYELYDDPRVRSGTEEYDAIVEAARAAGVGLTLQSATQPWADEMAKRTHLFQMGLLAADLFDDWLFVLDADEVVAEVPSKGWVLDQLDEARNRGHDVATALLWEKVDTATDEGRERASAVLPIPSQYETTGPRFWRALRDLRVVGYHYNYVGEDECGDTRELWGNDSAVRERASWSRDLEHHVIIENRNRLRAKTRDATRERYYQLRNEVGAEPVRALHEYDTEGAPQWQS